MSDEIGVELERLNGFPITGKQLVRAVKTSYGSWLSGAADIGLTAPDISEQIVWKDQPVGEMLMHLHQYYLAKGEKMTEHRVGNLQSEEVGDEIERRFHVRINGKSLRQEIRRRHGSWDNGVAAYGIDIADVHEQIRWKLLDLPTLIVHAHEALTQARRPAHAAALKGSQNEFIREEFLRAMNLDISGNALLQKALLEYGHWETAVRVAREEVHGPQWRGVSIARIIRYLNRIGITPNQYILRHRSTDVGEKIRERFGIEVTGIGLYFAGRRAYGTWDKALYAAGIEPDLIRTVNWDVHYDAIPEMLRHIESFLRRQGALFTYDNLTNIYSESIRQEMRRSFKLNASGKAIANAIYHREGRADFERLLKVAGVQMEDGRKAGVAHQLSSEDLFRIIRRLETEQFPLEETWLWDRYPPAALVIFSEGGVMFSGRELVREAVRRFKTWSNALSKAGVKVRNLPVENPQDRVSLPVNLEAPEAPRSDIAPDLQPEDRSKTAEPFVIDKKTFFAPGWQMEQSLWLLQDKPRRIIRGILAKMGGEEEDITDITALITYLHRARNLEVTAEEIREAYEALSAVLPRPRS
ncbi:MAG: hypothetical protein AB7P49_06050 [Bdellovibrionales bacterium]